MIKQALWTIKHWVYMLIFGRETREQRRAYELLLHKPVRYRWYMQAVKNGRPVGERISMDPQLCPKCSGPVMHTSHGDYCVERRCKWGWETEMDGSPLCAPEL